MNGIEKISARLISDAQLEVDAIKAEAEGRAAAIMAEYELKAKAAYDERMAMGRADCAARRERMAATADMEQRKAALAFKQSLVSEAFSGAVEAVMGLPRAEYIDFLARLMCEAAMNGEEEASFSEAESGLAAEVVKKANALIKAKGGRGTIAVSEETADICGGFILRSGNIEVNCAVDTLVMMQRSSLSSQVAEILFA